MFQAPLSGGPVAEPHPGSKSDTHTPIQLTSKFIQSLLIAYPHLKTNAGVGVRDLIGNLA